MNDPHSEHKEHSENLALLMIIACVAVPRWCVWCLLLVLVIAGAVVVLIVVAANVKPRYWVPPEVGVCCSTCFTWVRMYSGYKVSSPPLHHCTPYLLQSLRVLSQTLTPQNSPFFVLPLTTFIHSLYGVSVCTQLLFSGLFFDSCWTAWEWRE